MAMRMPPQTKLEAMIRQAMMDKAPSMYRELKKSGKLQEVIQTRVDQADEMYNPMAASSPAAMSDEPDTLKRLQMVTELENRHLKEVLETVMDFPIEENSLMNGGEDDPSLDEEE
jgi:hypothetical protein